MPHDKAQALLALAERVEGASGDETATLLIEAFDLTNWRSKPRGQLIHRNPAWSRFDRMIRAEAYESAAITLANGMGGQVIFFKDGTAKAFLWQPYPMAVEAKAATPALALCSAALRALATSEAE